MIRVAVYGLTAGILAATARMAYIVLADWAHNITNALTDLPTYTEEDD